MKGIPFPLINSLENAIVFFPNLVLVLQRARMEAFCTSLFKSIFDVFAVQLPAELTVNRAVLAEDDGGDSVHSKVYDFNIVIQHV